MSKLVSIILPTYNGEFFLRESIESCLRQTYTNIELIVVNDCSVDKTEELILSYADDRLRYVKNETNQKLPKSLNIGFSNANGEYLTWTSDDNFYKDDAIKRMVNQLENCNADIVYANYHTINNSGEIVGKRMVGLRKNVLLDNVVKACFLYKKEVQDKLNGYNPELFLVEDYDFWIRAAYNDFKFSPINELLYNYRFHENSLTESRRTEIAIALSSLLTKHTELFYKAGKKEFITGGLYFRLAKLTIAQKDFLIGRVYLKKGILMNPGSIFSIDFWKTVYKLSRFNKV